MPRDDTRRREISPPQSKDKDRGRSSSHPHKHSSHGSDHERSRTRFRDQGREKDRESYHSSYRDVKVRNGRGRENYDDPDHNGRSRNSNHDRHGEYDHGSERRHRNVSNSLSVGKSRNRSRSSSRSPTHSKSKRRSGFDMAPPVENMLPDSSVTGQPQAVAHTVNGVVHNILPFGTTQLGTLSLVPAHAMTQQATRHARRVYVGGLPPLANEQNIAIFFSHVMAAIGGNSAGPGDAVVNVYINHEKKFAFVEMRTVEEASNAMALDGIIFEACSSTFMGVCGSDGADRVFVGGLPYCYSEVHIRELLESFGPLRSFDLVKDRETGNSKGYGFCIYQDPAVTDTACGALNGLKMGDRTLTVRRASDSSGQSKLDQENVLAIAQQHILIQKMALQAGGVNLAGVTTPAIAYADASTKVLCLTEAITSDVLGDDEEYEEILEDMREECGKFGTRIHGTLVNVIIPRPSQTGEQMPGIGKVFLEYSDTAGCANARNALNGRKFGGNIVNVLYYPEDKFYNGDYGA
ncbi:hypothetical protein Tsubulata_013831 [Turnera subulata]|uniref:RRM domain-containing protein n=1 Tax=Turnera subulata TaxID=218843 RepID=A0A9Q0GIK9_9ROSI|nr:hypothetical protein Tsubulata_013831 [Turnera subulata]